MFALFIGTEMTVSQATAAGAAAGIAWVAASFGVNYLFERRSLKLWLIYGGYHTVQFIAFGAHHRCLAIGQPGAKPTPKQERSDE